jgi:Phosphotransferase enzyme family
MTAPPTTAIDAGSTLADGLRHRLPGLAAATDGSEVARRLDRTLLARGYHVDDAAVGSLWYQPDGTCALRFRIQCSGAGVAAAEHVVLGRVFPGGTAAAHYVSNTVLPLVRRSVGDVPPPPWRSWAADWPTLGLAVHPFPIDPGLPTLAVAMDPSAVRGLSTVGSNPQTASVQLVHHPREGACVVRYDLSPQGDPPGADRPRQVYGKVYRDSTGETVDRFLRHCAGQPHWARPSSARLPTPLGYDPAARLLLTGALPGRPLLPAVIKAALSSQPGGDIGTMRELLAAAGRCLAVVHAGGPAPVPVRRLGDVIASVGREIELVAQVWPQPARQVTRSLERILSDVRQPTVGRLCHGDFTPSQVLFTGTGVSGLVDLDTACWGDPAMDLGRFLAALDLLAVKAGAEATRSLLDADADAFLSGYRQACADREVERGLLHRVEAFRALSLARTALHACRALKPGRLHLALSLLDTASTRPGRIDP